MAELLVYYQGVREGRSVRECVPGTSGIVCFRELGDLVLPLPVLCSLHQANVGMIGYTMSYHG